jgi:nitroreductase
MMLSAHDQGVGSCWVMHFNPSAMRESFNIPENYVPSALLVMGYPAEDSAPIEMHSKFRPKEDVIFYDSF